MKKTTGILAALVLSGCSTIINCEEKQTIAGPRTYCTGKIAGDGMEGIVKDVYSSAGLESHSYGHGPSLWGQAMQGVAGSAAMGAGVAGGAAALRPDTYRSKTTLSNDQAQEQGQSSSSSGNNLTVKKIPVYKGSY